MAQPPISITCPLIEYKGPLPTQKDLHLALQTLKQVDQIKRMILAGAQPEPAHAAFAILSGYPLELIQFMHEHGCSLNFIALECAKYRDKSILDYFDKLNINTTEHTALLGRNFINSAGFRL